MGQDVYANELELEQSMEADPSMKGNRFDIKYSKEWDSKGEKHMVEVQPSGQTIINKN